MIPWETTISASGALIIGLVSSWLLFRGRRVEQEISENEVEATAAGEFLKGQQAFQAYVDSIVEKRVTAAVAELRAEVTRLTDDMNAMRQESHEMNDAIRSRETQLWLWNIRNRPGRMPELPTPILVRLGISHLSSDAIDEDTLPIT